MALERSARPLARCWQCANHNRLYLPIRSFTTTAPSPLEAAISATQPPSAPSPVSLNPETVSKPSQERKLFRETKQLPIASRRRRALLKVQPNAMPFEQLPYQCFQEARTFLQEDRKGKLEQIRVQRERIQRLREQQVAPQDEGRKEHRLRSMAKRLEDLKILADINDPAVKRRFEDGKGMSLCDMTKPIYRYLADRKWRNYERKVVMQRITQMNVVPDVLPSVDPTVSTALSFARKRVQHGDFVLSAASEQAPNLRIQSYEKGEKLVSIAVVNPDVPNVEKDGFDYRCHFLAANVRISSTEGYVRLGGLSEEAQVVLPWLPAYAQNGAPYQRMSVFVLEQPTLDDGNAALDVAAIKTAGRYTKRHGFMLRSLLDKYRLQPVGVDLFRTQWDEGTAGVMQRAGIAGWDVAFKRKRVEPLPYKKLPGARFR